MKKVYFLFAQFFICQLIFADSSTALAMSKPTVKGAFTVNLKCESPLSVGKFHQCYLDILGLKHFQTGKKLENVSVMMFGGMPKHAHGLPTLPKINWSDDKSTYEIQGLKFNMPGKWQLQFQIEDEKYKLKDTVIFNIVI